MDEAKPRSSPEGDHLPARNTSSPVALNLGCVRFGGTCSTPADDKNHLVAQFSVAGDNRHGLHGLTATARFYLPRLQSAERLNELSSKLAHYFRNGAKLLWLEVLELSVHEVLLVGVEKNRPERDDCAEAH
ncbi:unnamed protein product [Soboliphyme baturini]|uniref:FolB domain-containing protein n=1 Tax=Soboliphyme baturini TaxID=241478 RepID=A0A183IID1_9BILA|nr:unnamed protein product [Soboliphyme baturini]